MNGSEPRKIVFRSFGAGSGPIRRLMSPGDLGEYLKPFVFLDLFEFAGDGRGGGGGLHPHSGIATVTLFIRGKMHFNDPLSGDSGTLEYGSVEFMRSGSGVWHGGEMSKGDSSFFRGYQLWIALPPDLELTDAMSQYVEAARIPEVGPARVIMGEHLGQKSPVRAPDGITYLLVTLQPGETWTFTPEKDQTVGWMAVEDGAVIAGDTVSKGEIAVFEPGSKPIQFSPAGTGSATFVLGVAEPHEYPLVLGYYSVHTTPEALEIGERRIREIAEQQSIATR